MTPRPFYAVGARALLDTRKQGQAPARPVVVSLIGGEYRDMTDTVLQVRDDMPLERLDWRMLVNLEVWVWANQTVPLAKVLALLDRIARARPKRLCLRFDHPWRYSVEVDGEPHEHRIDVHDVDIGDGFHIPAVEEVPAIHEFLWSPVNLTCTPLSAQLHRAAMNTHPAETIL